MNFHRKSTGSGIFLTLALWQLGWVGVGSAQAPAVSSQEVRTVDKLPLVAEKHLYLQSSPEGQAAWQKLNADPHFASLLAWYAEKGMIARGDFFFDGRQVRDTYLIPLNESPLLDVQSTTVPTASVAHALEGEAVYLYVLRSKSQPGTFLWVTMRSSIQNSARVFRLEVGPEYLEYNSVTEKITKGKLSESDLISPRFDISQIGTVWDCLLAYLGLSSVSDLFSLINDYCNLDSGVQAVAQMVNGCVNPLNAVNCAVGVGAFLACAIGNVGTCANASSGFRLSSAPTSRIITQGQSTTFVITAAFTGGFSGPVSSFTISGLPSGVTYSFSPNSIETSGGATTLTVTTTSNAPIIDVALTVSAVGGNGSQNSIPLELSIAPSTSGSGTSATFTDTIVSKTSPAGVCSDPPSSQSFLTTDGTVYLYFYSVTALSDHITSDWLAPDSTVVTGGTWNPVAGNYCYVGISLDISSLPSSELGAWKARIYDNNVLQASVPFTVAGTGSGGGSPAPPPHITNVTPATVPVGLSTVFTITGSGFQQGFSGKLWVGSNSFPLNPGPQTVWLDNPNQVQLIVQVGALRDPTTAFGLQIINPDQQASAIYTGLTAQGGSSSSGTAGLGVSFSPNPTPLTSVSSCTSTAGKGYLFTFALSETQGVGLTPTGLSIDGSTTWTPIGFSQHIGPNGSNSFSLTWCRGSGNSVWIVTAQDDNGHAVTGNSTLTMQ